MEEDSKDYSNDDNITETISSLKSKDTVSQIKNITQEKKLKQETQSNIKAEKNLINSLEELIEFCAVKKEIKLKYELEKNVNLVSFEKNRIEISFNYNLDKNFVKDLSMKLFEWTGQRWIITLSKLKGEISIKEKEVEEKNRIFEDIKLTSQYREVLKKFPDANLLDVVLKDKKKNK